MKKPRILIPGSTNMDFVCPIDKIPAAGETILSEEEYFISPGGKGANCAVSAARLGADVIFCTCLGNDDYGKQLLEIYKKEGIDCRFIFFDAEKKTGLAHIFKETNGQNRITVYPGANSSLSAVHAEEAFTSYPDALLIQCETSLETVKYSIDAAKRQEIPVFLDLAPIRPDFDPAEIGECEVVSPNQSETQYYTGIYPSNADSCLRASIKLFSRIKTKYVVIKLGEKGCYIYDGIHQDMISPPEVKVKDTTGAGDAFTAALAVRYLQNGGNIIDAARFANCVGAYTVTGNGAFDSFPTTKNLETFINNYNNR